jgi:hypothetical protein
MPHKKMIWFDSIKGDLHEGWRMDTPKRWHPHFLKREVFSSHIVVRSFREHAGAENVHILLDDSPEAALCDIGWRVSE